MILKNKHLVIFVVFSMINMLHASPISKVWQQFETEKKAKKTTWLPDFSYAGFKHGEAAPKVSEKVFKVSDYGALPDDLKDDRIAIQRAVRAAKKNGGGIVLFAKGRYLVNTTMQNRGVIKIDSDNIIIKGAGSMRGGTIIHVVEPYGGKNPHLTKRLYFGKSIFLFHSIHEEKSISTRKVLCKVSSDSPRETFSISVDNTSSLKVGQDVYLYARNKAIHIDMIKPYPVDEKWTTITKNKAYTVEMHNIKKIEGNKITFSEPLRYDIKAKHKWEIRQFRPIKNVGIEDISFIGNSYHRYKHHRSGYDDSGWAFIKMKGVKDGWVRRCSFINCNQNVYVAMSANVTLMNLIFAGNKGHHIARSTFLNYGVLAGLMDDRAGFDHGPSLNWGCTGTVFWRCKGKSPIDSHAGRPYVTLFDNIAATGFQSSGGKRDYPQHLRFMVIWNMKNTLNKKIKYDFWKKNSNNCFLNPIIVGMHGKDISFVENKLEILESFGTPVKPESLYEAQLKLRLGKLPNWIRKARQDNLKIAKRKLPKYYDRNNPKSEIFFYKKKFKVDDLLDYVTKLSLQMYNSKLFTYKLADKSLELNTDRGYVRNTLYSLMYCIYQHRREGGNIYAVQSNVDGKKYIRFEIKSGAMKNPLDLSSDPYFADAKKFTNILKGKLKFIKSDKYMTFELLIPQTYLK